MSIPLVPASPVARAPRGWPLRLAAFLVALLLALLWALGLFSGIMSQQVHPGIANAWFAATAILLVGLLWLTWKRVQLFPSWRSVAIGAAVAVATIVALAWDDAEFKHRITGDDLVAPAGPEAAEAYAVSLWYTQQEGQTAAARKYTDSRLNLQALPGDTDKWREEITKHREAIVTEWERLAPEREWLDRLDSFAVIGDTPNPNFSSPLIRFAPYRQVGRIGCARAGLLALEGKGDEAADILARLLSVNAKVERDARTVMRLMVAGSGLTNAMHTTRFVLAQASVSPARRAALVAALGDRDVERLVHRAVWADYVIFRNGFLDLQWSERSKLVAADLGMASGLAPLAAPVLLLPRQTANAIGAHLVKFEAAGRQRDRARLDELGKEWQQVIHTGSPRNIAGQLLLNIGTVDVGRFVLRVWEVEDLRLATAAELAKS